MHLMKRHKPTTRQYVVPFTNGRYVVNFMKGVLDTLTGEYLERKDYNGVPCYVMFDFGYPCMLDGASEVENLKDEFEPPIELRSFAVCAQLDDDVSEEADKTFSVVPEWAIVIATFKGFRPKPQYLNFVEPLYVDGNIDNNDPANLMYRFREPVGPRGWPGYAYIPFFTRYAINEEGKLINLDRALEIKGSISRISGYMECNIGNDAEVANNNPVNLHQLVMAAWNPGDADQMLNMTIDHIDNNKLNNRADNLQWLSQSDNSKKAHAHTKERMKKFGVNGYPKGCKLLNLLTKEVKEFTSHSKCAEYIGCGRAAVDLALRYVKGQELRIVDGKYWIIHSFDEFPEIPDDLEEKLKSNNGRKRIIAKRLVDGKIFKFPSANAFFKQTGLGRKKGFTLLKEGSQGPLGDYLFKCELDDTPWIM